MAEKIGGLAGTLFLEGISLTLRLGALPFERIDPRRVNLDLTWKGDLLCSGLPVVDYSLVVSSLKSKLEPEYLFIEELARDALAILEKGWPGKWKVTVHKYHPPTDIPIGKASVTIGN